MPTNTRVYPKLGRASDHEIAARYLTWSDGLLAVAREYGFASWPRLRQHVLSESHPKQQSFTDRITDPAFKAAVRAIEDGDLDLLRKMLDKQPDLIARHVEFEGENYFRKPSLLAFVADNPVRTDSLPPNIVEITEVLLQRGAGHHQSDLDEALGLVATGRVAREAGVQHQLIQLLCSKGADPNGPVTSALAHGELAAVLWLLECGARKTLAVTAVLEGAKNVADRIPSADVTERQVALALAAQHGRNEALQVLLNAGGDPSRYNPPDTHAHSTPLHQAAFHGHETAVRLLLGHGANPESRDTQWNATPLDWARHARKSDIVALLESREF